MGIKTDAKLRVGVEGFGEETYRVVHSAISMSLEWKRGLCQNCWWANSSLIVPVLFSPLNKVIERNTATSFTGEVLGEQVNFRIYLECQVVTFCLATSESAIYNEWQVLYNPLSTRFHSRPKFHFCMEFFPSKIQPEGEN